MSLEPLILEKWTFAGLFGHMWLHSGFLHILFNLIGIWLFGNAVCTKLGNKLYPVLYVLGGVAAGATQLLFADRGGSGASGALMAILGIYVVIFTYNKIKAVCLLVFFPIRYFGICGLWYISLIFIIELLAAITHFPGKVAHYAHVGGFIFGLIVGILLVKTNIVERADPDEAIIELLKS